MTDLISRQEVIDLMYEVFKKYSVATDKQDELCGFGTEMFRRIKELPIAFDKEKVVENIKNIDASQNWNSSCEECINHTTCKEIYNEEAKTKSNHLCSQVIKKLAIEEVRKGGVDV